MRAAYIRGITLGAALMAASVHAGPLGDDPEPGWIPGLPVVKDYAGVLDFTSEPPGAQVMTSLGGTCQTPCSMEISANGPFTASFGLEGYEPATVQVKIGHAQMGVSDRRFAPNPVFAHLSPIIKPEPPKPVKTIATRKPPHVARRNPVEAPAKQPAASAQPAPAGPATPASEAPEAAPTEPSTPVAQPTSVAPAAQAWPAASAVAPAWPIPPSQSTPASPASPPWPGEVKPLPGINSGRIIDPQ